MNINKKKMLFCCLSFLIISVLIEDSVYAIPYTINYQEFLTDFNDTPIDSTVKMKFEICDENGLCLWTRERFVTPNDGFLNITLGKRIPLKAIFFDGKHYLDVSFIHYDQSKYIKPRRKKISKRNTDNTLQCRTHHYSIQKDPTTNIYSSLDLGLRKHNSTDGIMYKYSSGIPPSIDSILFSEDISGGKTNIRKVESVSTYSNEITASFSSKGLKTARSKSVLYKNSIRYSHARINTPGGFLQGVDWTDGRSSFIININSRTNSNSNPIVVLLDRGSYNINPIGLNDGGLYNAWNAWGSTGGCNNGICSYGWKTDYMITSESLGSLHFGSLTCYSSSELALSNADKHSITLNTSENINFYIPDCSYCYGDNTGGLSFQVELIQSLLINTPVDKDTVHSGHDFDITWSTKPDEEIANVTIEYSSDNQITWSIIETSIPNSGLYVWEVPNGIASGQCNIRISDATDPNEYSISQEFIIYTNNLKKTLQLNRQEISHIQCGIGFEIWSFSGITEQQVRLRNPSSSGGTISYDLFGPNGWEGFIDLQEESELIILPESATYTLIARSINMDDDIVYSFVFEETSQTELPLDVIYYGSFRGSGQAELFHITVQATHTMRIKLDDTVSDNYNELYLKYGSPPTRGNFDYRYSNLSSSDQEIIVLSANPGDWYLLVYGDTINSPDNYTLIAEKKTIILSDIFPKIHGDVIDTVLTLNGAGYENITAINLISPAASYPANSFEISGDGQAHATFLARSIPAGLYSVEVVHNEGGTDRLDDVFEMIEGGIPKFETNLILPSRLGYHHLATIYVEFSNTGYASMTAPVLILNATQNGREGALMTLDRSIIRRGFWTSVIPEGFDTSVQFVASGDTPGILQPGETKRIPIYYTGWLKPWNFSYPPFNFTLSVLDVNNENRIDWEKFENEVMPPNMDQDKWKLTFIKIKQLVGDTWGQYYQLILDQAVKNGANGEETYNVSKIFDDILNNSYTLAMFDGGTVVGQVFLQGSNEPLRGFEVFAFDKNSSGITSTLTDDEGWYALRSLTSGDHELKLGSYPLIPGVMVTIDGSQQFYSVDLPVTDYGMIKGIVTDIDGNPLENAVIKISALETDVYHATSSETGEYEILLPIGNEYTITCKAFNYINQSIENVNIGSSSALDYNFELSIGGTVSGIIYSPTGGLVDNAIIVIKSGDQILDTTNSNIRGYFEFVNIPVGQWSLSVLSDKYLTSNSNSFTISYSGETLSVNIHLLSGGSIKGNLLLNNGEPVKTGFVSIYSGDNVINTTSTDENGYYEINQLLPGEYIIKASSGYYVFTEGYTTKQTFVPNLEANDNLEFNFVFTEYSESTENDNLLLRNTFSDTSNLIRVDGVVRGDGGIPLLSSFLIISVAGMQGEYLSLIIGGYFAFAIPAGEYTLSFFAFGIEPSSDTYFIKRNVILKTSSSNSLNIQMDRGSCDDRPDKTTLDTKERLLNWYRRGFISRGFWTASDHLDSFLNGNGNPKFYQPSSSVSRRAKELTGSRLSFNTIAARLKGKIMSDYRNICPNDNQNPYVSGTLTGSTWLLDFDLLVNDDLYYAFKQMGNGTFYKLENSYYIENEEGICTLTGQMNYFFKDYYNFSNDTKTSCPIGLWANDLEVEGRAKGFYTVIQIEDPFEISFQCNCANACPNGEDRKEFPNDEDCDGIPDWEECLNDADCDGIPNHRDEDDDNNGKPDDEDEDDNGNGVPDDDDPDENNNGIPDWKECPGDADCNGVPDEYNCVPPFQGPCYIDEVRTSCGCVPDGTVCNPPFNGPCNKGEVYTSCGCKPEPCSDCNDGGTPDPDTPPGGGGSSGGAGSIDPNQKTGPIGVGAKRFIKPGVLMPYKVEFENDPEASAPAQIVTVTDQLVDHLDWTTFELTEIGFGDHFIPVPANTQYFEWTEPMNYNGMDFEVRIEAGIHLATGEVYANFYSIDPATGLPPGVEYGFLPPEDGNGIGQGYFSFVIRSKDDLADDTRIHNIANIVFDFQYPIATNQVDPHDPSMGTDPNLEAFNTIDIAPPTSSVSTLSTNSASPFTVEWTGDDNNGSGIAMFDIFISENDGPWTSWITGTTDTSATYSGENEHTYRFYSIATDSVGNREMDKTSAEAETMVIYPHDNGKDSDDGGSCFISTLRLE